MRMVLGEGLRSGSPGSAFRRGHCPWRRPLGAAAALRGVGPRSDRVPGRRRGSGDRAVCRECDSGIRARSAWIRASRCERSRRGSFARVRRTPFRALLSGLGEPHRVRCRSPIDHGLSALVNVIGCDTTRRPPTVRSRHDSKGGSRQDVSVRHLQHPDPCSVAHRREVLRVPSCVTAYTVTVGGRSQIVGEVYDYLAALALAQCENDPTRTRRLSWSTAGRSQLRPPSVAARRSTARALERHARLHWISSRPPEVVRARDCKCMIPSHCRFPVMGGKTGAQPGLWNDHCANNDELHQSSIHSDSEASLIHEASMNRSASRRAACALRLAGRGAAKSQLVATRRARRTRATTNSASAHSARARC